MAFFKSSKSQSRKNSRNLDALRKDLDKLGNLLKSYTIAIEKVERLNRGTAKRLQEEYSTLTTEVRVLEQRNRDMNLFIYVPESAGIAQKDQEYAKECVKALRSKSRKLRADFLSEKDKSRAVEAAMVEIALMMALGRPTDFERRSSGGSAGARREDPRANSKLE